MSAQKTSASRTKPVSAVGAFIGFVGFSALAGLLVTIGVTPAIAVAGVTTTSTIGVFESLPEYIEIGDLPQRNELYAYSGGKSVHFATLYDQNRQELKFDQISDQLKNAAIDGEDKRFYDHGGVDMTSLIRAGVGSIAGGLGDSGGGSTLTMQLVRNIKMNEALNLPTKKEQEKAYNEAVEQTIPRKLEEMKLAIGLAKKYSKKEILTAYLNIAYFGDQTYGVQAAAQHYYNKSATDLTPAEAASLIAIVQYPEARNLSSPKKYDANVARRNVVLRSMYDQKNLTEAEYRTARQSKPADYVHLTQPSQGCRASVGDGSQFFCDYAKKVVLEMSQLGSSQKARDTAWRNGGYKIQTTLNIDLNAEQKRLVNTYDNKAETNLALGATLNSIEAGSGRIVTMAQNKDFDESLKSAPTSTSLNYSVDEKYGSAKGFQTGSTYKLFTLLAWLQAGHGLNEVVSGAPRDMSTGWTQCGQPYYVGGGYRPKNDSPGESGNYTVAAATAQSINLAFLNMAQKLDLCDIKKVAESLGVHRADGGELLSNPSSVLGINEIAPMTMAAAYAAVANNGIYCKPIAIDQITSPSGKKLGGQTKDCKQAIDPEVAHAAVYAMKGTIAGGTARGAQTPDGMQLFGKTGTTDDGNQIWLVGSSSRVATAYWQGNTDGKLTNLRNFSNGVSGTYAASRADVWRQAQTPVNAIYPAGPFTDPNSSALRGNAKALPNLQGKTADEARAAISGAGFTYVDGGARPGPGNPGSVTSTSPAAGALLSSGSSVTVYTSDGTQATVPEIGGDSLGDARSALNDAGFTSVNLADSYAKGGGGKTCKVAAVEPAINATANKNDNVTIQLYGDKNGKAPKDCK
ncbi:transglycosylase domain-containing protein [Curtobacterium flaccumfaciens]|jgi:membrane peptidoglycan carboxypeptidase|uniref:transglycosylase domain-containing protein n=1 Tax=Curtobacterium flaccumfaciens TaxID=2035 RepID=UPI000FFE35E1|nr:transglycosylase domain-containing protein [Curtobacterium flaccumfaciens]MCS0645624.1 transglycosylase domain-containing protein [Curtobacterium flaccumfaciens pv. flaccumfaciens]MCS6525753.1 transglycosylase domain-containing protein [Curtobacterium flaccumfaciens pv. flaccumfaciens]MCS6529335.1 transglycosylase domain-containing protein [Curtobacterium flaccumfaciens pv. flaccumfaciens]MCS6553036.1 transglycosylase domain-containing protein [Curtobacterium flaccumfaciens pv. flaccumfacien